MKYLLITIAALALANCNTMIGIGRDTKQGFDWCSRKIQESQNGGGGGGGQNYDNAPVY
jgi:predicted small secreted protein